MAKEHSKLNLILEIGFLETSALSGNNVDKGFEIMMKGIQI